MLPHDLFAAVLAHKGVTNVEEYYPSEEIVPIASLHEIRYKNIPLAQTKKGKKWAKEMDVEDFGKRVTELWAIWASKVHRCIMMVGFMRNRTDLHLLMQRYGNWSLSENDLRFYQKVFWDTSGWLGSDYQAYLCRLPDTSLDYNILNLLLSNTPEEVVLNQLGVFTQPKKYKDLLERMALVAHGKYLSSAEEVDQLRWGKFAIQIMKEIHSPLFADANTSVDDELIKRLEKYSPIFDFDPPEGGQVE